jgi:hypothetical protein
LARSAAAYSPTANGPAAQLPGMLALARGAGEDAGDDAGEGDVGGGEEDAGVEGVAREGGGENAEDDIEAQHRRYDRRQCGAANSGRAPSAVANRKGSRRRRSRKRRPVAVPAVTATQSSAAELGGDVPQAVDSQRAAPGRAVSRASDSQRTARGGAAPRAPARARARSDLSHSPAGERPPPPWHPLPLSELLILLGAIGVVVGLSSNGPAHGGPPLFAGLGAVILGTLEVTLREHLGGYRSHTLLLALLPVIVFHSAVVIVVAALASVPAALNVGLLVIDVALFALLFKALRVRFLDARLRAGRR